MLEFFIEHGIIKYAIGVNIHHNKWACLVLSTEPFKSIAIAVYKHFKNIAEICIFLDGDHQDERELEHYVVYFLLIAVYNEMLVVFERRQYCSQKQRT